MVEVVRYLTESGTDAIGEWLHGLRDARTRAKVAIRFARLAAGNFGDCKPLAGGVWELRINWGPGYRVYYALSGETCVLLCGGDKRTQSRDLERAMAYWSDYRRRTGRQ